MVGKARIGTPALFAARTGPADPEVIAALDLACHDAGADRHERLALFRAAVLASGLRPDPVAGAGGRIGPLAQDNSWGVPAARRYPYVAASVFLKEARRLRNGPGAPRTTAGLAALVQGHGSWWRYLAAGHKARAVIAGLRAEHCTDLARPGSGARPSARTATAGHA
jgi:hypothetical protein